MLRVTLLVCAFLCACAFNAITQLDQSNMVMNYAMNISSTPGTSFVQVFRASVTGILTFFAIGFVGPINGTALVTIYENLPQSHPQLPSSILFRNVTRVFCATTGNCFVPFQINAPSIAEDIYTFEMEPVEGFPDPYYVMVGIPGSYGGNGSTTHPGQQRVTKTLGVAAIKQGMHNMSFYNMDLVFLTHVCPVETCPYNYTGLAVTTDPTSTSEVVGDYTIAALPPHVMPYAIPWGSVLM